MQADDGIADCLPILGLVLLEPIALLPFSSLATAGGADARFIPKINDQDPSFVLKCAAMGFQ